MPARARVRRQQLGALVRDVPRQPRGERSLWMARERGGRGPGCRPSQQPPLPRVEGLGIRVEGFKCVGSMAWREVRVWGVGYRVYNLEFRDWGLAQDRAWLQGSGFRLQASGFRVQGSGFRVQGAGCRVQGSGFTSDEGASMVLEAES